MMDSREIRRRNNYWAEHWQDFACDVLVSTPERRQAHVGMYADGLFGSLPIPFTGHEQERGRFMIHDGCFWVYTSRSTYSWPIQATRVEIFDNGVEIRVPNKPVVQIRGPIGAALAGAYRAHGLLQ